MTKIGLSGRATAALSVAAVSFFLLLCFTTYGRPEAETVRRAAESGIAPTVAGWFVSVAGAGAYVIALLGVAWGVIVYFQERTPDLALRCAGTAVLAVSTAMIAGLLGGGERSLWAGSVGTAAAGAMIGWGPFGTVLGWLVGLSLFGVSLVFATDWLFHTLRRGATALDPRNIPTEPSRGDLLDDPAEQEPRQFIRAETRAAEAAATLPTLAAPVVAEPADVLPPGWSRSRLGGREVVRAPQGYAGVEFLPHADELAVPADDAAATVTDGASSEMLVDDFDLAYTAHDEFLVTATHEAAPEATAAPTAAPADRAAPPRSADAAPREGGIGLADPSILLDDDLISVEVAPFSPDVGMPHDGGSVAADIVAAFSPEAGSQTAEAPAAPEASDAQAVSIDLFDDVLVVDGGYVVSDEDTLPPAAAPSQQAAAGAAEPAATVAPEVPSAPAPADAPNASDSVGAVAAAASEVELWDFPQVSDDDVFGDAEPMPTADEAVTTEVPSGAVSPFESVAVEGGTSEATTASVAPPVAPVSDAPIASVEATVTPQAPLPAPVVPAHADAGSAPGAAADPAVEPRAVEPRTVEPRTVEPPVAEPVAVAPVIAHPPAVVPADEAPAAPAVVVATPVESPDPAAAASLVPAAHAQAESAAKDAASQLALFPPPTCDLTKLIAMELDPLFHAAAEAILLRGRASAVVLQRALGIGYARGLRILDQMTAAGMLGPDTPGGAREICYTRAQWDAHRA